MNEHNDDLLVAEYALGLLDHLEAAAIRKRLTQDSTLRKRYLNWTEHLASLYLDVEEVTPPPALKATIEKRLFSEKPVDRKRHSKMLPWLWPVNLVSSLLLAGLVGFIYHNSQQPLFNPDFAASLETDDQSLQVVAHYDESHGLLQVSSTKAIPDAGRSFELWLIAGDNPPVSLGILSVISQQKIKLPLDQSSQIIGSTLAISDEPAGGSSTGSPTGPVLTTAKVLGI